MGKTSMMLFISILIFSCQAYQGEINEKQEINLKGNWEYLGFGKAITIGESIVKGYHISSVGNVQTSDNTVTDFFNYYTVDTISKDTILLIDGVKSFKLFRSKKDFSENLNTKMANDPKYNFEILWTTFNEQYVYFNERNVDWNKIYNKYEPQIKSDTEPLELYLIFEKMLGEIRDSHISIDLPENLEEEYLLLKNDNTSETTNEANGQLQRKIRTRIVERYLNEPRNFNRGSLRYGKINNSIGYIQIQNMVTMAHYDLPESLSNEQFWGKWWENLNSAKNYHDDVREGTRFMMDSIFRDLGEVKAYIIDLRFNGGGFDDASIEILNHFVNQKTLIGTKKVRLGNGYTEEQTINLIPSKKNFNGKLFILTSHETASAAELVVLGSKELPDSKIIGSTTEGVFSDILSKKLPNGWTYGLSNMIYESSNGVSFEKIGITPDYKLNYPVKSKDFYEYLLEDLKDGDEAIEKVIEEFKVE